MTMYDEAIYDEAMWEAIEEAERERDWHRFLLLHPRADRPDALQGLEPWIEDDAEYWALVGEVWIDTERPSEDEAIWRELFGAERPGREALIDPLALASLPDPVRVFRGFDREGGERGLSWTTDRERADWFARRFAIGDREPRVAIGTVDKSRVIAYPLGRREAEIVALPEDVDLETVELIGRDPEPGL